MLKDLLRIALSAAVPLRITAVQARGGPSDFDVRMARKGSQLIVEKGDLLLFGRGKCGEVSEVFTVLVESLAVLAFCPGGVTCLGEHWEVIQDAHESGCGL